MSVALKEREKIKSRTALVKKREIVGVE